MKKLFLIMSLLLSFFCSNLRAEEEIKYEYEDFAPVPKQMAPAIKKDYGPMYVDQYEGDHNFWWYEKNQKKYRFYMGMSLPYNFASNLSDVYVESLEFPADITNSSGDTIISSGTTNYTDVTTNITTGDGIGFTLKTGVEYRELVRFDIEIGTKRLFIDSMDAFDNVLFLFTDSDISLMYNYVGANLTFEWPRGIKSISPFAGFGMGGGYFSTSGLGDDFVPYLQASAGITYRFNKSVALEIYATSFMITSDFAFTIDYDIDTINGETDLTNGETKINMFYNNAESGDLTINSLVIAYRFLF